METSPGQLEHNDDGQQDTTPAKASNTHTSGQGARNPKPRRRRHPPSRSEADIARDSMIDQIMKEGQVPIYDRPDSSQAASSAGEDRDAAAAAAFRAEFLAAAEERNLHRRPPVPPAAGASLGPKLGGSRQQRERMKAAEEAKGKGGAGAGGK